MADYVTRSKAVVANIKSMAQENPSNAFLLSLGTAFVRQYSSQWQALLISTDNTISDPATTIVNPENTDDLTDIGTWDGETFSALSAGDRNKLIALHHLRIIRDIHKQVYRSDKLANRAITTDEDGLTPAEFQTLVTTEVETESLTELGDPSNDPES